MISLRSSAHWPRAVSIARRGARHPAAQGRVPSLLLPPPAARQLIEADPPAELRGPRAQGRLPTVLTPRRSISAARAAGGRESRRAARPGAAGDDVRLRPAGVRDDFLGDHRSRSRAGVLVPRRERDRRSASCPSAPAAAAALQAYLSDGRPPLVGLAVEPCVRERAGPAATRQGLYKIIQARRARRPRRPDEPAHAPSQLRHAPARGRL